VFRQRRSGGQTSWESPLPLPLRPIPPLPLPLPLSLSDSKHSLISVEQTLSYKSHAHQRTT